MSGESLRIELGGTVTCSDGVRSRLLDVVVDPAERRLRHVVVRPTKGSTTRLVPAELLTSSDGARLALDCDSHSLDALPTPEAFALMTPGEMPVDGPEWD